MTGFETSGWRRFAPSPDQLIWAAAAKQAGQAALADPALAHWYQCGGTWFVGVDALPNTPDGGLSGAPLGAAPLDFIAARFGPVPALHPAQLSVVFPGYPQPRTGETAGNFRYRQRRDAAHVDGIRAEGPERRRFVREPHAWILGLPLTQASAGAAPLVVWEGSHTIMARALSQAFAGHPPERWGDVDVTKAYQEARQHVFDTCARVALPGQVGEAMLLHPLLLHGVAPWEEDAQADPAGRMIAYFRPEITGGVESWVSA